MKLYNVAYSGNSYKVRLLLAQFAYTHVADEGGFPLDDCPKIRGWIKRVTEQPKFLPMSS